MSVRLIHGDCLEQMASLPAGSVDAIVTDPPYMLGAASARKSANKTTGWADINNASYWYAEWMREAWRTMNDTAGMWVFGNWRSLPVLQCAASKIGGMSILSVLVWDKDWLGVGSMNGLRQQYEIIVLFGKSDFSIVNRSTPDIWKDKWCGHKPTGHPQEKPVSLGIRIMAECGLPKGATVFDPFMGSGSFGVSCVQTQRNFIGVEMDEQHFCLAQRRIADAQAQQLLAV